MNKDRFVEFYLTAMVKAATAGHVRGLAYRQSAGTRKKAAIKEFVDVTFADLSSLAVDVTGSDFLGIALEVVKAVQKL